MTIKQRQCLLFYLGYYVGEIDGVWGTLSKVATMAFQKDFGLKDDGICGAETEKALKHAVAYGMSAKKDTDTNVGNKGDSYWKSIKYFKRSDPYIGCSCGKCGGFPVEPSEKLMRTADKVRVHFGEEMIPTSTVRCAAHNTAVGGVKNSRHLKGKAMDFKIKNKTSAQILAYVQKLSEVRYAYAVTDRVVHMDVE